MEGEIYHIPALLTQCIDALDIRPGGVYIDCTFGGGGHSRAILERLHAVGNGGRLFGFDRDPDAIANIPDDDSFTFVHSNFRYLTNWMRYHGVDSVDGILADLGVSFHHFDNAERGFSFRQDAPLDMRMNANATLTAAQLIEESDEARLDAILRAYTDLRQTRRIAAAIIKAKPTTTFALAEAVRSVIPPTREKKELAQVFQALRIEVNDEMGALRQVLQAASKVLRPGGRLAVITYHSIEDRLVKNWMRAGNFEGEVVKDLYGKPQTDWKLITRTPITPDDEEVERNPRSRSAKLRVAEKI